MESCQRNLGPHCAYSQPLGTPKIITPAVAMPVILLKRVKPPNRSVSKKYEDEEIVKDCKFQDLQSDLEGVLSDLIKKWELYEKSYPQHLKQSEVVFLKLLRRTGRVVFHGKFSKEASNENKSRLSTIIQGCSFIHENASFQMCVCLSLPDIISEPWSKFIGMQPSTLQNDDLEIIWKSEGWILLEERLNVLLTSKMFEVAAVILEVFMAKGQELYNGRNDEEKTEEMTDNTNLYFNFERLIRYVEIYILLWNKNPDKLKFSKCWSAYFISRLIEVLKSVKTDTADDEPSFCTNLKGWNKVRKIAPKFLLASMWDRLKNPGTDLEALRYLLEYGIIYVAEEDIISKGNLLVEDIIRSIDEVYCSSYLYVLGKIVRNNKVGLPDDLVRLTYIEIYCRAMMVDIKNLEVHKAADKLDKEYILLSHQNLSAKYVDLADFMCDYKSAFFQLVLTAHTLCPQSEYLEKLFPKVIETDNIPQVSTLDHTVMENSEALGLPAALYEVLCTVIYSPRLKVICSWTSIDELKSLCTKLVETGGEFFVENDKLEYLHDKDFDKIPNLRPNAVAYDDGVEKGYGVHDGIPEHKQSVSEEEYSCSEMESVDDDDSSEYDFVKSKKRKVKTHGRSSHKKKRIDFDSSERVRRLLAGEISEYISSNQPDNLKRSNKFKQSRKMSLQPAPKSVLEHKLKKVMIAESLARLTAYVVLQEKEHADKNNTLAVAAEGPISDIEGEAKLVPESMDTTSSDVRENSEVTVTMSLTSENANTIEFHTCEGKETAVIMELTPQKVEPVASNNSETALITKPKPEKADLMQADKCKTSEPAVITEPKSEKADPAEADKCKTSEPAVIAEPKSEKADPAEADKCKTSEPAVITESKSEKADPVEADISKTSEPTVITESKPDKADPVEADISKTSEPTVITESKPDKADPVEADKCKITDRVVNTSLYLAKVDAIEADKCQNSEPAVDMSSKADKIHPEVFQNCESVMVTESISEKADTCESNNNSEPTLAARNDFEKCLKDPQPALLSETKNVTSKVPLKIGGKVTSEDDEEDVIILSSDSEVENDSDSRKTVLIRRNRKKVRKNKVIAEMCQASQGNKTVGLSDDFISRPELLTPISTDSPNSAADTEECIIGFESPNSATSCLPDTSNNEICANEDEGLISEVNQAPSDNVNELVKSPVNHNDDLLLEIVRGKAVKDLKDKNKHRLQSKNSAAHTKKSQKNAGKMASKVGVRNDNKAMDEFAVNANNGEHDWSRDEWRPWKPSSDDLHTKNSQSSEKGRRRSMDDNTASVGSCKKPKPNILRNRSQKTKFKLASLKKKINGNRQSKEIEVIVLDDSDDEKETNNKTLPPTLPQKEPSTISTIETNEMSVPNPDKTDEIVPNVELSNITQTGAELFPSDGLELQKQAEVNNDRNSIPSLCDEHSTDFNNIDTILSHELESPPCNEMENTDIDEINPTLFLTSDTSDDPKYLTNLASNGEPMIAAMDFNNFQALLLPSSELSTTPSAMEDNPKSVPSQRNNDEMNVSNIDFSNIETTIYLTNDFEKARSTEFGTKSAPSQCNNEDAIMLEFSDIEPAVFSSNDLEKQQFTESEDVIQAETQTCKHNETNIQKETIISVMDQIDPHSAFLRTLLEGPKLVDTADDPKSVSNVCVNGETTIGNLGLNSIDQAETVVLTPTEPEVSKSIEMEDDQNSLPILSSNELGELPNCQNVNLINLDENDPLFVEMSRLHGEIDDCGLPNNQTACSTPAETALPLTTMELEKSATNSKKRGRPRKLNSELVRKTSSRKAKILKPNSQDTVAIPQPPSDNENSKRGVDKNSVLLNVPELLPRIILERIKIQKGVTHFTNISKTFNILEKNGNVTTKIPKITRPKRNAPPEEVPVTSNILPPKVPQENQVLSKAPNSTATCGIVGETKKPPEESIQQFQQFQQKLSPNFKIPKKNEVKRTSSRRSSLTAKIASPANYFEGSRKSKRSSIKKKELPVKKACLRSEVPLKNSNLVVSPVTTELCPQLSMPPLSGQPQQMSNSHECNGSDECDPLSEDPPFLDVCEPEKGNEQISF